MVIWVQLLPIKLPGQQEGVSLRLHESYQAATAAAKQAEWNKQQRVWVQLEVRGFRGCKVGLIVRTSPFPLRKHWSEWEREFAVSIAKGKGK